MSSSRRRTAQVCAVRRGWGKGPRSKPNREPELRIAAAILRSSGDPRAEPLLAQMALRRRNLREERSDGFVVKVPSTTEDLLIDLDVHVDSRWVRLEDVHTGEPLEFRVTLHRGGFLHSFEARAVTGLWPAVWDVDDGGLEHAVHGALRLPASSSTSCHSALAAWLGVKRNVVVDLVCFPPAGRPECEALVRHAALALPDEYVEFVAITNGCDAGSLRLYGTRDVHAIEIEGRRLWVLGDDSTADCHYLSDPATSTIIRAPTSDIPANFIDSGLGLRDWLAGTVNRGPAGRHA